MRVDKWREQERHKEKGAKKNISERNIYIEREKEELSVLLIS